MVGIRSDLSLTMGRIAPDSVTITSPDRKPSSSVRNSCVLCDVFATTGNTVRFPCLIGERTLYPEYELSPACTCLLPANAIPNTNPHSISTTNNLVIMLSSRGPETPQVWRRQQPHTRGAPGARPVLSKERSWTSFLQPASEKLLVSKS